MAKRRTLFRLVDEDRHFSPDLSPIHIVIITNLHDWSCSAIAAAAAPSAAAAAAFADAADAQCGCCC